HGCAGRGCALRSPSSAGDCNARARCGTPPARRTPPGTGTCEARPAAGRSSPASTGSSRSSRRSCGVCGPSAIPYELACLGGCKERLLVCDLEVEHVLEGAVLRLVERLLRLAHGQ